MPHAIVTVLSLYVAIRLILPLRLPRGALRHAPFLPFSHGQC